MLTRDQILGCQDIKIQEVHVPEWGGSVFVKSLTGKELDVYQAGIVKMRGDKVQGVNMENMRARMCAMAICDAEGKRLFTDADVELLAVKNSGALNRVFMVIQKLSGLSDEELKETSKN